MAIEQTFIEYFKPEIQKRGRDDFKKGIVFITNFSDTQIQALIKGMPSSKVTLSSESISSHYFSATCSCSLAAKGSYCKHMWAVILATEEKHPDFLEEKTSIEKNERSFEDKKPQKPKVISAEAEARAEAYKEKQKEFKKAQSERQKAYAKETRQRIKELKKASKTKAPRKKQADRSEPPLREKYSDSVEQALEYFTKNGFVMNTLPTQDELKLAKKHLSRVYHPDKGGTHDEAVILNKHFDVLIRFLNMIGEN